MIAETLARVAKTLFEIFASLDETRLKRKARIADYFSDLAQTVEDTSAYLKKGEYPSGECEELRFYAEKMVPAIGDIIGEAEAQEYADKVLSVWEIEQMHGELLSTSDAEKEEQLRILDEAAGYFRAVSAYIRVSR